MTKPHTSVWPALAGLALVASCSSPGTLDTAAVQAEVPGSPEWQRQHRELLNVLPTRPDTSASADFARGRFTTSEATVGTSEPGSCGPVTTLPFVGPSASFRYHDVDIGKNGSRAYQALGTDGIFRILDISDPTNPSEISSWVWASGGTNKGTYNPDVKYFEAGGRSYVAVPCERVTVAGTVGVYVFDVTDDTSIAQVAQIYESGVWLDVHNVFVYQPSSGVAAGHTMLALTADNSSDAVFYDITDPAGPIRLGAWHFEDSAEFSAAEYPGDLYVHDVTIQNDLIQLSYWNFGLRLLSIDAYDPSEAPGLRIGLTERGYYADAAIRLDDSSDSSQPVHHSFGTGGVVFLQDEWPPPDASRIKTIDTSAVTTTSAAVTASTPPLTRLHSYHTEGEASHNLEVAQGFLAHGSYRAGVQLFDVSDPTQPLEIFAYERVHGADADEYDGAWQARVLEDPVDPSQLLVVYSDRTHGLGLFRVDPAGTACGSGGGSTCGDAVCDGGETCDTCEVDCGACPSCLPVQSACDSDAECCSGKCRGKPGGRVCK